MVLSSNSLDREHAEFAADDIAPQESLFQTNQDNFSEDCDGHAANVTENDASDQGRLDKNSDRRDVSERELSVVPLVLRRRRGTAAANLSSEGFEHIRLRAMLGHCKSALEWMGQGSMRTLFDDVFAAFLANCGPGCTRDSSCTTVSKSMVDTREMPTKKPFPSMDCRTTWHVWFKGDTDTTYGVPYRRYRSWQVTCDLRACAKRTMIALVQIAVAESIVPSSMPEAVFEGMADDALMGVFDVSNVCRSI
ncbi:Aste57867_5625 [Aphanomyces stellatus]|uniref:Aste57867_5625 protein n=1 Tax=Aphanomyces stellatus TaxID=120398 RepID=A0A485KH42_9STRA|nr:hypothetical protein As57867_005612 [Aphanomyces stellatus]VFT82671.1 Aste57867_5625 [Aphanomyces stellatus]